MSEEMRCAEGYDCPEGPDGACCGNPRLETYATRQAPKVKPLEWDRQDGGSYAWALGLHYYTEKYEGKWSTSAMINNDDFWNGGEYPTRLQAEKVLEAHFKEQVSERILSALEE